MRNIRLHTIRLFALLLILVSGAIVNDAWAAKVIYHVLTLPLDHTKNHNIDTYDGKRLEAIRIIVDNGSQVELPALYRSPLAMNFKYWAEKDVDKSTNTEQLYQNNGTKAYLYEIDGEAEELSPGSEITKNSEIYVTYTYNYSNTIADLTGGTTYNIMIRGGFLAYNRGRNNRPAVVPEKYITAGMLATEDFVRVDLSDGKSGITTYWNNSSDNKNKESEVGSQFNFLFTYEGEDPYNIVIRSKYNNATECFIEKNMNENKFYNKYYKGATLYAHQNDNIFLSSDDHIKYTYQNQDTSVKTVTYDDKPGYFHGLSNPIWGSFVLLNNTNESGYVFMASRTVNDNGVISDPSKQGSYYKYNYLTNTNNNNNNYNNNLSIKSMTSEAADNYSTAKEMYMLKNINFIVTTPFGNSISATKTISEYFIKEKQQLIDVSDIPDVLKRKYCTFNSKFYKSPTFTKENEITKYSEATADEGVTYNVYVGYEVSASIPFKSVTAADTTWYELTDAGSTQEYGRKIKFDGTNFKNNGANGEYVKASEFAFIGDPYELRVISRSKTWDEGPGVVSYVGATGTPPSTGTLLTASTSATEGYNWYIPNDAIAGSFLLREFNGSGHWSWTTEQPSGSVAYGSNLSFDAGKDAQTITFNVTGLAGNKYIKITTGGTDVSQIVSVIPAAGFVNPETGAATTITVKLVENTGTAKTMTVTIQEYDDDEGSSESGTASVITITQGTSSSSFTASSVEYSTASSTYIKVLELPKRKFTYNIIDKAGNIAAKATASQAIYSSLSIASIPSIIVSPFILDETISFYTTYGGTGRGSLSSPIVELTEGNPDPEVSTNIYVKYTTTKLDKKPAKLNETQEFNVKLNGVFLYYDQEAHELKTDANPSNLTSPEYLWELRNRDPYAMLIDNLGARKDLSVSGTEHVTVYNDEGVSIKDDGTPVVDPSDRPLRQKGAWVILNGALPTTSDGTSLIFTKRRSAESEGSGAYAQRFIAKSSTSTGIYEVMIATDNDDANTTYYNIGCPKANTVKIYNNSTYVHGKEELRFILNQNLDFTYHLIDMAKHELLTVNSKNLELALPEEYQSPLVAVYHYYARDRINIDETKTPYEYTPINSKDTLSAISDLYAKYTTTASDKSEYDEHESALTAEDASELESKARVLNAIGDYYYHITGNDTYTKVSVSAAYRGNQIFVTYEKNNLVTFNDKGSPYMLKFLDGRYYKMEDGNDKLTSVSLKATYPYTNGDGSLNIYGDDMQKEQFNGGASTRPRWIWFFESDHNDPYHVKIHSKSTISYKSVSHPTYLQTYAVHFNQDTDDDENKQHIVTGGILSGIASVEPTEYMILGSEGAYKLLTTQPVKADLDGDGNTTGDGENERQEVKSLEQYWKTYNMIKLHLLGKSKSTDAFSNDESTWVVPGPERTALETKLVEKGIGSGNWHSYDFIANAVRWNGYNDKTDGHEKKVVENLEHWFQTFDMGDGTFDIESASIPPVLVLLDRHGWEIMRKPLPTSTYPYGDELDTLKVYDSPMVKEYKFYSNATKATGCHKYVLRMQNGAERDQIKVNGVHYTSKSLGTLPPLSATGVKDDNGVFQDQYVTYTVKEEYENSYKYHLELHEEDSTYTESGTASKFLILQHGRYIRHVGINGSSYISKPIHEASNVPNQAGTVFDMILAPSQEDYSQGPIAADHDRDGKIDDVHLWYVQPNLNIDLEMGIKWAEVKGASLEPHTEYETKKEYKDKTGFDPYNLQFKNAADDGALVNKYITTHATTTSLDGGAMVGNYTGSGGSTGVTLENGFTNYEPNVSKGSEGYDHTNIQMSNQTFMAVQDAYGNMQLMPRFDHKKRVDTDGANPWNTTLEDPKNHTKASIDDNSSMGNQTTFLVHPQVFEYHIIDHKGNEALSYKRAGDYAPDITEHFKSPLAYDFKYYFGHAAYTTSASSKKPYDAAYTSGYFKKEAASAAAMETAAKALTVLDDYYFKVTTDNYNYVKVTVTTANSGSTDAVYTTENSDATAYEDSESERTATDDAALETAAKALTSTGIYYYKVGPLYNYKKVTVTKAHSEGKDATYNTADCTESEWTNAIAYQREATSEAAMQTEILSLGAKGLYYYQLGSGHYAYKKVVRADGKNTITISDAEHYSGPLTATDEEDFEDKAKALSSDGTYYYKIGLLYNYQKVIVNHESGDFKLDVAAKKDISDKEITGSFADAGLNNDVNDVYVRYKYWEEADVDQNKILQGKWFTIKLNDKDVLADGTLIPADGTGVSLKEGSSKPGTIDADDETWQWKFLVAPVDPESEYYEPADPYAVEIFNREKNYSSDLSYTPNPMSVPIKINGANHFVLLSHPNGGYALAAQGSGYTYTFLNGTSMTTIVAATTTAESTNESDTYHFTIKSNALSPGAEVYLIDDVTHTYTYNVINNDDSGNKLAVSGTQTNEAAKSHNYAPYLPDDIQSPLLNATDYSYYGNVSTASAPYKVVEDTKLHTLFGLYKDEVYVRYGAYDVNQTKYKVPNKRNATGTGQIAKDASSKDASLNINGRLPYNIIWYSDDMMQSTDNATITSDGSKTLSGDAKYTWQFDGGDPYALKIKHKTSKKYINNSSGTTCTLENIATPFMLLNKDGYDYGVLQVTEGTKMLSGHGNELVESSPTKFIIFGLSVNDLIYHLVICPTNSFTPIPYRETEPGTEHAKTATWEDTDVIQIEGSTQRDLESRKDDSEANPKGSKYQLGTTMSINDGSTTTAYPYNFDAGSVSIGDMLEIPTEFYRPNCSFDFYIDGIYDSFDTETQTISAPNSTLNNLYKGVKLDEAAPRLMSDENLINKVIRVNVVYSFDKTLATNSGLDFVRNVSDNFWYTFETYDGSTPYLAHYTNAWGLQSMEGRATRYTNDYLWTPLGDPYGFLMYNRYMIKNSGANNKIMTTSNASFSDDDVEGTKLKMEEPTKGSAEERNAVYELLSGDADGYFRIHPVINTKNQTQYYVRRYDDTENPDYDDDGSSDLDYTILSTEPCDWRFGLDMTLLEPYYERAGYIGGLTTTPKEGHSKSGKELYEAALKENIVDIQKVVYDDNNIVDFEPGYYRLHSMPGTPGISTIRYASGYLHKTELTGDGEVDGPIPMHFYSTEGTSTTYDTLKDGFTKTKATQGEIPIAPTENDPSTIFYFDSNVGEDPEGVDDPNPRVIMSTQKLYVKGNVAKIVVEDKEVDDPDHGDAVMTANEEDATIFSLIGIGGTVFLITDKLDPPTRNYLHYSQDYVVGGDNKIYDLKFFHNSPTNEARWCIEPVNNKGLKITTNKGNDGFYYTTFCAPFDVKLPNNVEADADKDTPAKNYYAYICEEWNTEVLHPKKVGQFNTGTHEGDDKFIPAGTPVIIRTTDNSESIKLTCPSNSPTSALSCVFSGKYLEQLLDVDATHDVYTLGLPFTSSVTINRTTGDVTAELPKQANTGVGFYINANPNKEHNASQSLWLRNNRYVIHNKIYYRDPGGGGSSARGMTRSGVEFVPLIFDWEDIEEDGYGHMEEEELTERHEYVGDGCVYDMQGRRVATEEQVLDGTWKQRVSPGIYIINGKKISVN